MHEVRRKVNAVFSKLTPLVVFGFLSISMAQAGGVEGFLTQGSQHWGISAVAHRKFRSQSHLSENEIAQAKARDLDEFIEADSPFGWLIGLGALQYDLSDSYTPALRSATTQSFFLGLTADTESSWFFDFTLAMDRTSKLEAANNGIDFKISYLVEWSDIRSTFQKGLSEVASIIPGKEDEISAPKHRKRKHYRANNSEDDERLHYPFMTLTLNPIYQQYGRKLQSGAEYTSQQTGFIFSSKFFPHDRLALKGTYGTFIYQKGAPKDFYHIGEVKSLIPVRAGPVGSSAFIRSFPKHYAAFNAQIFSALYWESEWSLSRTSFHHKEIKPVYSPSVGVFRVLKNSQTRIGATLDLFKGGMSGYSLGVHFTRFW